MSLITVGASGYLILLLALAWMVTRNRGPRPEREDYEFLSGRGALTVAPPYASSDDRWRAALVASVVAVFVIFVMLDGRGESSATTTAPEAASTSVGAEPTATLVPTVAPTSTVASAARYTVAPGDTLSVIAARLGVSVASLQQANQLNNPDQLTVGQVLTVPQR